MYSITYLQTLRVLEARIGETVEEIHHLEDPRATEQLRAVVGLLSDYVLLVEAADCTLPRVQPADTALVTWCLRRIREGGRMRIDELEPARRTRIRESELLEVVAEYVLVPLGDAGPRAFAWLPLLDLLEEALAGIAERLDRLAARAGADCDAVLGNLWFAVRDAASLLSLDVSTMNETLTESYRSNHEID